MAAPAAEVTSDENADRYLHNLVSAIQRRGVRVDDSAYSELQKFAQTGAVNLREATPDERKAAEGLLNELASEISEDAAFDESSKTRTATAQTVRRTRRRWCPRYPWC
jgi:hypothetical protein